MDRRHFLRGGLFGIAPFALATLIKQEQASAKPVKPNLQPRNFTLQNTRIPSFWVHNEDIDMILG